MRRALLGLWFCPLFGIYMFVAMRRLEWPEPRNQASAHPILDLFPIVLPLMGSNNGKPSRTCPRHSTTRLQMRRPAGRPR